MRAAENLGRFTMTIEQAGQLLRLSRSSAYRAAARGELPTLRFGRRLIVPTGRLLTLLGFQDLPGDAGQLGKS